MRVRALPIHPPLQALDPSPERFHYVTDMSDFIVLRLQLVDHAEDVAHAGNLPVGGGDRGGGFRGGGLDRAGCLGVEL